jgi:hypothetical protein
MAHNKRLEMDGYRRRSSAGRSMRQDQELSDDELP